MTRVRYDETYNEPKPKRYWGIRCFDCKLTMFSKNEASRRHRGHELHYVTKEGEIDE